MSIEQEFPIGSKFIVESTMSTEHSSRVRQFIGKEVEIIGHFKHGEFGGVVFIDDGDLGVCCGFHPYTFLTPVKTEREKAIKNAKEVFSFYGPCPTNRQLEKAYDKGILVLPNN